MNLVTGATGLLGSHIAAKLRADGRDVRGLVRPSSDTSFLDALGVEKVTGDVTDAQSVARAMKGVKTVYHAAARVGDWGPWQEFVSVTVEGTRNMVEAAAREGVERFLHISSISAYGHPDGEGLVLDESAPLGQNLHKWSYYSRAKVAAEEIIWAAHCTGRVPVTVIRPSWLYGERDRASMPRLIRAIKAGKVKRIGDGSNRLNLTYAGNEADGCILAAGSPKAAGQAYNLCNDGVITQAEYFEKIANLVGAEPVRREVPYKVAYGAAFLMEIFGHMVRKKSPPLVTRYSVWLMGRRCLFSTEKIRRELGYEPAVGYDEGIRWAVEWALEHA
ncbi:MAG: epimerase [Phycisphaerae bacterium SM23_33]|jgi:nucleoside-diphosphate-sugar epimerase|nr:MAG: epimerase [Phycisphaerae bacterium SM23_33]